MNEKINSHLIEANVHLQDENKVVKADNEILKRRIERAIEHIKETMNNSQSFYKYLYGDENGEIENLDKLLNILKGEDKE